MLVLQLRRVQFIFCDENIMKSDIRNPSLSTAKIRYACQRKTHINWRHS